MPSAADALGFCDDDILSLCGLNCGSLSSLVVAFEVAAALWQPFLIGPLIRSWARLSPRPPRGRFEKAAVAATAAVKDSLFLFAPSVRPLLPPSAPVVVVVCV